MINKTALSSHLGSVAQEALAALERFCFLGTEYALQYCEHLGYRRAIHPYSRKQISNQGACAFSGYSAFVFWHYLLLQA